MPGAQAPVTLVPGPGDTRPGPWPPMIRLENVTKRFGRFAAVDSVSLSVNPGELVAFLGPNGAGKTTTIRMLMGMLVPTEGRVTIDGLDCFLARPEVMRRVGYLPDELVFPEYMRGREVLEFMGEMQGMTRPDARARALTLLAEFGLLEAGEEYAMNYSMGMKKKLGLASAMVHEPPVWILDEPTNGLDPRAARDVDLHLDRARARGQTIFLSTHLLDRAERLDARVAIIDAGKLVAAGPIGELRQNLATGGSLEEIFLKVTETPAPLRDGNLR